jgi:peptidoglycan pentaglycine glycine transferase (the first glycine)
MRLGEPDAADIERLVQQEVQPSLLQSWMWGEFQHSLGRTTARVGVRDQSGQLIACALLVRHELPFGLSYTYVPRGPIVAGQISGKPDSKALKELLSEISVVAQSWKSAFVRLDPPLAESAAEWFTKFGYREAASQTQPRVTARLDLGSGRDKILAGMKSKARYNIRLATKKGVVVRESIQPSDAELFIKLNRETTERDEFVAHEDDYYRVQFEMLGRAGLLKLFVAEYEQQPLAVIAVGFHGNTAVYLHGTSSNLERNRMPTFAVQWEAIKSAERLGMRWYDFHGVAPTDDSSHPWAGITRFKLGFGAQRVAYMGALDLPLKKFAYAIYRTRVRLRPSDGR